MVNGESPRPQPAFCPKLTGVVRGRGEYRVNEETDCFRGYFPSGVHLGVKSGLGFAVHGAYVCVRTEWCASSFPLLGCSVWDVNVLERMGFQRHFSLQLHGGCWRSGWKEPVLTALPLALGLRLLFAGASWRVAVLFTGVGDI